MDMVESKIDVIIPTKDIKQVRPKLMQVLQSATWVKNLIIETSSPLATARIKGAEKCTTEWVAMFDDDVEIPVDWFEKVTSLISDGVVGVSSPDMSAIPDYYYMQLLADKLLKLSKRDTPFIDNCIFKRSTLKGYNPPLAFYCEDEFFYEYVKRSGKWLHTDDIGVIHYYREKDAAYGGASQRIYKFESRWNVVRRLLVRTAMGPMVAIAYTHKLSTIKRFWGINWRFMVGWIFYKKYKVGIPEAVEVKS